MIDFVIEREIARPPEDVFGFVVDPAKLGEWQTDTVSAVADGPIGLGTKIREVRRAGAGQEITVVVEVVDYEPGRRFGVRVVQGLPVHREITMEPSPAGTLLRFRVYHDPPRMLAVAQPVVRMLLKRQFNRHCTNLKTVLESGQLEPANPSSAGSGGSSSATPSSS